MKKNLRSFLIPTVAAISTLISNPSYSSKHSSPAQDTEKESKDRLSLDGVSNEKFLQIAVDGELQNLILDEIKISILIASIISIITGVIFVSILNKKLI